MNTIKYVEFTPALRKMAKETIKSRRLLARVPKTAIIGGAGVLQKGEEVHVFNCDQGLTIKSVTVGAECFGDLLVERKTAKSIRNVTTIQTTLTGSLRQACGAAGLDKVEQHTLKYDHELVDLGITIPAGTIVHVSCQKKSTKKYKLVLYRFVKVLYTDQPHVTYWESEPLLSHNDCKAHVGCNPNKSGYTTKLKRENDLIVRDGWSTPDDFMGVVRRRWNPMTDVCATAENHKCPFYITPEMDALKDDVDWFSNGYTHGKVAWCNPGYSNIVPWLNKAVQQANDHGVTTLVLTHITLAKRVASYFELADTIYMIVNPRISFIMPEGVTTKSGKSVNNRDNMLWVFTPASVLDRTVRTVYWNWKDELSLPERCPFPTGNKEIE